ncbi:hypothetical protein J1605_008591 [Eschrichtius robustus]|uniref:HAP1 N-terminal domain-containing protein n=1 Tax=Eschrichtius robustus TaxID=9764 RepID=A0AB34GUD5_ESCRO|nr:hypothetical protein J1605_008591 [Eschrichtius robustus]
MTWAPRVTFGTLVSWFVNVFLHFTLHCLLVCERSPEPGGVFRILSSSPLQLSVLLGPAPSAPVYRQKAQKPQWSYPPPIWSLLIKYEGDGDFDVCNSTDLPEVEIISLLEEQLPHYKLRADTIYGYDHDDWLHTPLISPDANIDLTTEQIEETLKYFRE